MENKIKKIKENPGKAMQALAKWSVIFICVCNLLIFFSVTVGSYYNFGTVLFIFIVYGLSTIAAAALLFIPLYAYGALIEDVSLIKRALVKDYKADDDFTLPML